VEEGVYVLEIETYYEDIPVPALRKFVDVLSANTAPVADAGPDQTVERTSTAGGEVTLDGSASYDPDGDPLTYTWTWEGGGSASGISPTVTMPMGRPQ